MKELSEFVNREPFVPFRITLTSGSTYDVMSPYQVVVEGAWLNYLYARSDRAALLRLNQLAAIETLDGE